MEKVFSYLSIIFVLFITSGTGGFSSSKNVVIAGLIFFAIAYFYFVRTIKPAFIVVTVLFILLSGIYYLKNNGYNEVTYLGLLMKVYIAYFCRELCREHFFRYFVNIIYVLACISLPLYIIQLINFDFLYHLNNIGSVEAEFQPISYSYIFVTVPIHEFRNCGFMWEPGAFAAVMTLTMYINIFKESENFFSKRNLVFLIAILTTQSTMGFLSLLIHGGLVFYESFSENKTIRQLAVVIVPILLAVFIYLFISIDFLSKKIFDQINSVDEELAFVEKGSKENFTVATTRLTSLLIDMESMKKDPLLGLGVDMFTVGKNKRPVGETTVTSCGLSILAVRFGFLGLLAYIYLFYRQAFFEENRHKIGWVCLILIVLFTNDLSGSALVHLFVF